MNTGREERRRPRTQRHGEFDMRGVVTLAAGHAVHDTYTAFVPPLLPEFIRRLSLSNTEAGILSVTMQFPSLLQPALGRLADTYNLKYFILLAPATAAVLMSLLGVPQSYALLTLFLLVVGVTSAGFHATGPVMVGYISGSCLGRGMSYWMVGGELGRTLGPIVVVSAVTYLSLKGLPLLMLAGLAASALLLLHLQEVPWQSRQAGSAVPLRTALSGMKSLFIPLICVITVRAFMLSAVTIYLPTLMTSQGSDLWVAGASLTAVQAAGVIGALISGSLSDRIGRKRMLFLSLSFAPFCMFLMLLLRGWQRFAAMAVLGFFTISITPVIMALVQEHYPQNRALANGIYMSLSFGIRSGAAVVLGAVGDWLGLPAAFAGCAVLMLLGLPVVLSLPYKHS